MMKTFKNLCWIVPLAGLFFSCSYQKKAMRKAANAVDECDYEKAIGYYQTLINKDSNSFYGNAGKGIVLSEYMERYEQAIPYLERAREHNPDKTLIKLNSDLGKSYHHIGNYSRALYYYSQAGVNDPDHPDYDAFLSKRIADCKYAIAHKETASPDEQWVKNVGNTINTPMPEYGPVVINDQMIFTSKRQDDKKEKKNVLDGKYYEASYISTMSNGSFSEPKRFVSTHQHRSFVRKRNESVVSASSDGKTLFVFREGMIYETNANDTSKTATRLDPSVNVSHFQNHAYMTPDGKQLFFTSETGKEGSGTDIYLTSKDENGKWGRPELLEINTEYSEDAPFLSEDGTLYFSSNGLPGYGGFDVYRTHLENGRWTTPQNLGQPINSPGDDIYFVLKPNSSYGYYSSSRAGGYGDMDIYQVHYIHPEIRPCASEIPLAGLITTQDSANPLSYKVSLDLPEPQKNRVKYYTWKVNGQQLKETSEKVKLTFPAAETYTIAAEVVIYCDTCPNLITMCTEKPLVAGNTVLVSNEIDESNNANTVANNNTKNNVASGKQSGAKGKNNNNISNNANNNTAKNENEANAKNAIASQKGYLSPEQLDVIGWNEKPAYFETNHYDLNADAVQLLDQNVKVLENNAQLHVTIDGYADSRGPASYNKMLSAKRANAIRDYFVKKGVAPRRITTIPHGEEGLLNNCSDGVACEESQHQQNRRVQFRLSTHPVKNPASITLR